MNGCKCKPAKSFAEQIIEYKEFVSLVKKMREAQNEERKWEIVNFKTEEDKVAYGNAIRRMYQLEFKVDEWLKDYDTKD